MPGSVSWVMSYHTRPQAGRDRVGGVPDHLPHVWPRCQLCQGAMGFVGQLYACDLLPLRGSLGLQIYLCDGCREAFNGGANDRLPIHMELLTPAPAENSTRKGVRCRLQPVLHIAYTPTSDSIDQWTFNRSRLAEEELPDTHLRSDKVGGLFPYDGSDGPKITRANRMIAQFTWAGVGGPIYLFDSSKRGVYPYHYR
ncbi:unnamed protein product [Gemmataceae bacterium]|nr:unnamed protein product [Gemmataceae bacterium]VTT97752.1 unnamed protein product [Gemmataceae bacterium]